MGRRCGVNKQSRPLAGRPLQRSMNAIRQAHGHCPRRKRARKDPRGATHADRRCRRGDRRPDGRRLQRHGHPRKRPPGGDDQGGHGRLRGQGRRNAAHPVRRVRRDVPGVHRLSPPAGDRKGIEEARVGQTVRLGRHADRRRRARSGLPESHQACRCILQRGARQGTHGRDRKHLRGRRRPRLEMGRSLSLAVRDRRGRNGQDAH